MVILGIQQISSSAPYCANILWSCELFEYISNPWRLHAYKKLVLNLPFMR